MIGPEERGSSYVPIINAIGKNINNISSFMGRNVEFYRVRVSFEAVKLLSILKSNLPTIPEGYKIQAEAEVKEKNEQFLSDRIDQLTDQITDLLTQPDLSENDRMHLISTIKETWINTVDPESLKTYRELLMASPSRVAVPRTQIFRRPSETASNEHWRIYCKYKISKKIQALNTEVVQDSLPTAISLHLYLDKLAEKSPEGPHKIAISNLARIAEKYHQNVFNYIYGHDFSQNGQKADLIQIKDLWNKILQWGEGQKGIISVPTDDELQPGARIREEEEKELQPGLDEELRPGAPNNPDVPKKPMNK